MNQGCPICGRTSYAVRRSPTVVECFCGAQYVLPMTGPSFSAAVAQALAPLAPGILQAPEAIPTLKLNGINASPPPTPHICATCRHWAGSLSSFQAACSHVENSGTRPAYDWTCGHWARGKTD